MTSAKASQLSCILDRIERLRTEADNSGQPMLAHLLELAAAEAQDELQQAGLRLHLPLIGDLSEFAVDRGPAH